MQVSLLANPSSQLKGQFSRTPLIGELLDGRSK
jgi:hypothetical protein